MKPMKLWNVIPIVSVVALTAAFTSCVTVNVNFPESAVQKATDDYVRDLYRAKEKGKLPTPQESPAPAKTSLEIFDNFSLVSRAWAAEDFSLKVDSPKALKIRDQLSARVEEVIKQKKNGIFGETLDGRLILKDPASLKPLLQKKLEKLVKDENSDRTELYEEILTSNALSRNRIRDIEKSFARSFQAESPSGTWIQNADESWIQKP